MTFTTLVRARRGQVQLGAVLAVLAMVLAGCGLATNPASAAPDQYVEPPAVSQRTQELYSTEDIVSIYDTVTSFALKRAYDPALMNPKQTDYTADQLNAGVLGNLTPALEERWKPRVDSALKGNADDQDALRVLQFYNWEQPTWELPADGRPVRNQWIRNAEIGVTEATEDMPQRPKVTIVHQAGVRYIEDGGEFDLEVAKRVSYWLVPNPGGNPAWLIDAYEGVFAVGEELPVLPENQAPLPAPTSAPMYVPPAGAPDVAVAAEVPPAAVSAPWEAVRQLIKAVPVNERQPQSLWRTAPRQADAAPGTVAPSGTMVLAATRAPATTTAPGTTTQPTTAPPTTTQPTTAPPTTTQPTTAPPTTTRPEPVDPPPTTTRPEPVDPPPTTSRPEPVDPPETSQPPAPSEPTDPVPSVDVSTPASTLPEPSATGLPEPSDL